MKHKRQALSIPLSYHCTQHQHMISAIFFTVAVALALQINATPLHEHDDILSLLTIPNASKDWDVIEGRTLPQSSYHSQILSIIPPNVVQVIALAQTATTEDENGDRTSVDAVHVAKAWEKAYAALSPHKDAYSQAMFDIVQTIKRLKSSQAWRLKEASAEVSKRLSTLRRELEEARRKERLLYVLLQRIDEQIDKWYRTAERRADHDDLLSAQEN